MNSSPSRTPPRSASTSAGAGTTGFLDRALPRPRVDVNESLFAVLFAELCRYSIQTSQDVAAIETKLSGMGFDVGFRMLELVQQHLVQANKNYVMHRETRLIPVLQFITSACWQFIYGKPLDSLERSTDGQDTYLVSERDPLPIKFASVPRDFGELNLAAFNAGILAGLLCVQGFDCTVHAHFAPGQAQTKVVYVVKFDQQVVDREAKLARLQ